MSGPASELAAVNTSSVNMQQLMVKQGLVTLFILFFCTVQPSISKSMVFLSHGLSVTACYGVGIIIIMAFAEGIKPKRLITTWIPSFSIYVQSSLSWLRKRLLPGAGHTLRSVQPHRLESLSSAHGILLG